MTSSGAHALPVRGRRLWLGVLSAPAAWLVALLAGYAVASRSCEPAPNGLHLRLAVGLNVVLIVLALVLLAAALGALWMARDSVRAIDGTRPRKTAVETAPHDDDGGPQPAASAAWGRARFMAAAGVLVAVLFAFGIVLFGFAPLVLSSCTQAH
jgi:hypothetical protein